MCVVEGVGRWGKFRGWICMWVTAEGQLFFRCQSHSAGCLWRGGVHETRMCVARNEQKGICPASNRFLSGKNGRGTFFWWVLVWLVIAAVRGVCCCSRGGKAAAEILQDPAAAVGKVAAEILQDPAGQTWLECQYFAENLRSACKHNRRGMTYRQEAVACVVLGMLCAGTGMAGPHQSLVKQCAQGAVGRWAAVM
eukprot:1139023-Pelagomonas_calceolata.AAC.2